MRKLWTSIESWISWTFLDGRSRSRFANELGLTHRRWEALAARGTHGVDDPAWIHDAEHLLDRARERLEKGDPASGWQYLKAARRALLHGLDDEERRLAAEALLLESRKKMNGWRRAAVESHLVGDDRTRKSIRPDVSIASLKAATEQRDESADNAYHRLGLVADQLGMLFWIAVVPALATVVLTLLASCLRDVGSHCAGCESGRWGLGNVLLVMSFGVLGAAFSLIYSVIATRNTTIPEVSDKYITIIRTWCGAIAALAGHALMGSGLVDVRIGNDGLSSWIAMAFIFGCAGERIISRVVESVAGDQNSTGKAEATPEAV